MSDVRVLIVDDQALVREGIATILDAQPGITVVGQAADGAAGLAEARRLDPDVVCMDVQMPDMDGYEAIPIFKSRLSGIPVIAVTAQAMVGDREKCLAAGADGYVSKPVNIDLLMDLLKNL